MLLDSESLHGFYFFLLISLFSKSLFKLQGEEYLFFETGEMKDIDNVGDFMGEFRTLKQTTRGIKNDENSLFCSDVI